MKPPSKQRQILREVAELKKQVAKITAWIDFWESVPTPWKISPQSKRVTKKKKK